MTNEIFKDWYCSCGKKYVSRITLQSLNCKKCGKFLYSKKHRPELGPEERNFQLYEYENEKFRSDVEIYPFSAEDYHSNIANNFDTDVAYPVYVANWNNFEKLSEYIEHHNIGHIVWSDQYAICGECSGVVETDTCGESNFRVLECEIMCMGCLKENPETVIDWWKNETTRAIPSDLIDVIEKEGFSCVENDECPIYASGLHRGDNDTPEKALENLIDSLDYKTVNDFSCDYDYIFAITDFNMFTVNFTVMVRKIEE
jgi:hypothetical protein